MLIFSPFERFPHFHPQAGAELFRRKSAEFAQGWQDEFVEADYDTEWISRQTKDVLIGAQRGKELGFAGFDSHAVHLLDGAHALDGGWNKVVFSDRYAAGNQEHIV